MRLGSNRCCITYIVWFYFIFRNRRARNDTITTELQYEPGLRASGDVIGSAHMTTTQIGPQQCQAVICHTKRRDPEITEYTHVWNVHPPGLCTERQYSSSTFNPNYDHSCVTLQPTYDTNTTVATPGAAARKTQHSSLKNISGTPPAPKTTGKELQPTQQQQQNIVDKRRSLGNLLEEIPTTSSRSNTTGNGNNTSNNNMSATLGARTHFCELHGNV